MLAYTVWLVLCLHPSVILSCVSVSVVFLFLASTCKMSSDPSAGIDSDCSEVPGYLPSMLQKPEDVPSVPEETVTVKVSSCYTQVTALFQCNLWHTLLCSK